MEEHKEEDEIPSVPEASILAPTYDNMYWFALDWLLATEAKDATAKHMFLNVVARGGGSGCAVFLYKGEIIHVQQPGTCDLDEESQTP